MFGVGLAAAVATTLAVVVALFGPGWRERRRRPVLTIDALHDWDGPFAREGEPISEGYHLTLSNAPGKSTAMQVEVRLDVIGFVDELVGEDGSPLPLPLVEDRRLNFIANDGSLGSATASVPPGSSRRVYLMRAGSPNALFQSWYPVRGANLDFDPRVDPNKFCGAWATVPARQDEISWVRDGDEYEVVITLLGSNFDAQAYAGRVRAEHYVIPDDDPSKEPVFEGVNVKWLRPLKETPFSETLAA